MTHIPGGSGEKNNFVQAALNQTLILCVASGNYQP